jgi:hypothetical protein
MIMAALHNSIFLHAFPLLEFESVAAFIKTEAFRRLDMKAKAALIFSYACLSKSLERLTNPDGVIDLKWSEFVYRGVIYQGWSYVGIYTLILRLLWEEFPARREAMALAMGNHGRINCYVARSPEALFPAQSRAYALANSCEIADGWYVDTIIGRDRLRRLLSAAIAATTLKWDQDVIVRLRGAQLAIAKD